jgi:hypothetical protein
VHTIQDKDYTILIMYYKSYAISFLKHNVKFSYILKLYYLPRELELI